MKILALEFSSPGVSIALLQEEVVLGEMAWQEQRAARQPLFDRLPMLMREHGISYAELDFIAVGRGPGNYSGLRVSLAAAQALALPNRAQIYTVSSGEALARYAGRQTDAGMVAVVGDARRQSCWFGLFERQGASMAMQDSWQLCAQNALASSLPASARLVSPEYSRLAAIVDVEEGSTLQWLPGDHYPSAAGVGQCAWDRIKQGLPSDPPHPLYLHPAVAVKS